MKKKEKKIRGKAGLVCRIRGFARARGRGGFELKLNIRRWRNHTGKD